MTWISQGMGLLGVALIMLSTYVVKFPPKIHFRGMNRHFEVKRDKHGKSSTVAAETGDRWATIGIGRKEGGRLYAPFSGELGPNLTHCGHGRDLPPYQIAS